MPRKPLSAAHKAAISRSLKGKKRGSSAAEPKPVPKNKAQRTSDKMWADFEKASAPAPKPKKAAVGSAKSRAGFAKLKGEIQQTAARRGENVSEMASNARTRITAREDQMRAQVRSEKPARARSRSTTSASKARSARLNRGVH